MYALDLMQWEDVSFGWALFAVYGLVQVAVTFAVCMPLERWRPVEHWPDSRAVLVDVLYTLISRVGLLPLVTFVMFYTAQVALNGFMTDHGWVPPTLERLIPGLLGQPALTFFLYVLILDFTDYWRHRLSHIFNWWYSLHALHHAQRQMTFWSDDRNHLLDDVIAFVWFTVVALLIGIPPMQFPLLVLLLRLLESLSHANTRLSFGSLSPRPSRGDRGGAEKCQLRRDLSVVGHDVPHRRLLPQLCRDRRSDCRGGVGDRRLRHPAMGGAAADGAGIGGQGLAG
jgi:sterol desaturase/sphingolipid hydroxylase (fatty acid hydroxylase superfamily)